jgi:glycine cleavage system H protein
MSHIPSDLKYARTHEWVRTEDDGTLTVGITDHAQDALGDVVFIELPEIGTNVQSGDACAVIESVKAASDIYAPVDGEVIDINRDLADEPEAVNADAYTAWLFRLKPADGQTLDELLDAQAYEAETMKA